MRKKYVYLMFKLERGTEVDCPQLGRSGCGHPVRDVAKCKLVLSRLHAVGQHAQRVATHFGIQRAVNDFFGYHDDAL